MKKRRCFKYRKQGHICTDKNAFCKDQATISDQKLMFDLQAIEVKISLQQYDILNLKN